MFVNFLPEVLNEDGIDSRKSRDLEYTEGRDHVEHLKTKREENQTYQLQRQNRIQSWLERKFKKCMSL